MPADNLAIMLPKSMTFSGQGFQQLQGDASGPGTQTFLATSVKPGTPIAFTVSGTGSMPREQQQPRARAARSGHGNARPVRTRTVRSPPPTPPAADSATPSIPPTRSRNISGGS